MSKEQLKAKGHCEVQLLADTIGCFIFQYSDGEEWNTVQLY